MDFKSAERPSPEATAASRPLPATAALGDAGSRASSFPRHPSWAHAFIHPAPGQGPDLSSWALESLIPKEAGEGPGAARAHVLDSGARRLCGSRSRSLTWLQTACGVPGLGAALLLRLLSCNMSKNSPCLEACSDV